DTVIYFCRCQLYDQQAEVKEVKEQLKELVGLLRQSEAWRKEVEKELKLRERQTAMAPVSPVPQKQYTHEMNGSVSPVLSPVQKQLKYTPGIANGSTRESAAFIDARKMIPLGQLSRKKLAVDGQSGKLWRWKRSHHQWLIQFKWKWQKPWRLSEWIKHCDETVIRSRPRPHALTGV
ncbi:Kinesin-like protein, partial [Drosera capensis]